MKRKSQAKNKTATLAAALALGSLGAFGALASGAAYAQHGPTGLALAQQQNCMSCHSVTRTFMGPALRDVAAKYAGKPDAPTYLTHKILEGSTGVWGTVPMPANTQLNPGQAATLANWILTLK
ncbi:c-type cytochrome [Paraburkholderia unamae]|uniref:Cytochrome c n=1 Tax=Paraburkholderia unamae TaxID=219649 RepID=A0ABX5KRC1_9BURK|nr:c-type cytochrome [Paraburkholderia unamae]PVX82360.1 cytochrome c [Paraburkholderia unamae]RAR60684.1 cytochrome c [Paraburkholderia unamae]CAG9255806.1 Cytochrome c-552 [Paraburkholderia unamae]